MKRSIFLFMLFLLAACSKKPQEVTVGVDPSFFPLEIQGKEANVFAFSTELLQEICQVENLCFDRVTTSWDNLLFGLREGQYQTALSSLNMYVFNTAKYSFSDMYLETGPVLVVPVDSSIRSLEDLSHGSISVEGEEAAKYVLSREPSILVQVYGTTAKALDDVNSGMVGGALIPYIPALSYVNNIYQGQLKIVSSPALNQGLRLITSKDAHPTFIKKFNAGLEKLKASGRLDALKKKWALI